MDNQHFINYRIEERSYVALLKREIHSLLVKSQFSKARIAEVDIVIAELTSNLIKHAGSGEFLYKLSHTDDKAILELVCIDNGPGIADVNRMLKDGMSTTNTLGHGLGAIQRLSDFFQIYSMPKWGTVCYARIVDRGVKIKNETVVDVKAITVAKQGESVCGDAYAIKRSREMVQLFLGDGLGHGPHAREAMNEACAFFMATRENDPVEMLRQMHNAVRKTRGLVASVAALDLKSNEWKVCGVGNILTRLYSGLVYKNYMAYNGIVGMNIPTSMKSSIIPAERNQHIVMCSDGLKTRWDMTKYPSILKYDGHVLSAALYKDFSRGTDDSSVLVGKIL